MHLSTKPATRLDLLMRVVRDEDVDRRQVQRRRRQSRALLIARNFPAHVVILAAFEERELAFAFVRYVNLTKARG